MHAQMEKLLEDKLFVNSSLSVQFPRCSTIRRQENLFEDALKNLYIIPSSMFPIGDDIEPEIPRFTYSSKGGHSQISFSQVNASINTRYDGAHSKDYSLCETYILERLQIIYPILEKITNNNILYVGFINKIQYCANDIDKSNELLKMLTNLFLSSNNFNNKLHDLSIKWSLEKNDHNFINLSISNFRNFNPSLLSSTATPRLPKKACESTGIQIVLDINDRKAFNENDKYKSDFKSTEKIITMSKDIIENKLDKIIESGKVVL